MEPEHTARCSRLMPPAAHARCRAARAGQGGAFGCLPQQHHWQHTGSGCEPQHCQDRQEQQTALPREKNGMREKLSAQQPPSPTRYGIQKELVALDWVRFQNLGSPGCNRRTRQVRGGRRRSSLPHAAKCSCTRAPAAAGQPPASAASKQRMAGQTGRAGCSPRWGWRASAHLRLVAGLRHHVRKQGGGRGPRCTGAHCLMGEVLWWEALQARPAALHRPQELLPAAEVSQQVVDLAARAVPSAAAAVAAALTQQRPRSLAHTLQVLDLLRQGP